MAHEKKEKISLYCKEKILDTGISLCYNTAGIKERYLTGGLHGRIGDGAAV